MTRAVMTIHGFLSSTDDFGHLKRRLNNHYDAVKMCEIPGHNGQLNFKLFTKESTLDTVLNTFDELASQYDLVDVIGFSMGGGLATMVTSLRKVNRLVLIAPANKYINASSLFKSIRYYIEQFNQSMHEATGDLKLRWQSADNSLEEFRQNSKLSIEFALKHILPNLTFHTFGVFRELMKHCNSCIDGKQIATPTFCVWGELDELVPRTSVDYVTSCFSNLKLKTYKGLGHAMILTNEGKKISGDIIRFLFPPVKKKDKALKDTKKKTAKNGSNSPLR